MGQASAGKSLKTSYSWCRELVGFRGQKPLLKATAELSASLPLPTRRRWEPGQIPTNATRELIGVELQAKPTSLGTLLSCG